ncbi:MAG: hypothetical protein G8237_07800 [Magnetococcales bacterium]|nr:hypothetical protein [Magnetococcales bacterium]NGZ06245.1 hypothetical protein [Magnetococcales bacterium]
MAQRKIHDSASSRVMAYRKRRQEGMKRVEIWLTDDELAQLDQVVEATGSSRARVVAQLLHERKVVPGGGGDLSAPPPSSSTETVSLSVSTRTDQIRTSEPVVPRERKRAERGKAVFLASLRSLAPGG